MAMNFDLLSARRATSQTGTRQATFEALIEQNWDALWRFAFRQTGNRDEAEDLLSETLLEGYRSLHQFRGDASFTSWMYRIMITTRIDMVRRARRHRTESLDALSQEERERFQPCGIPDRASNPETLLIEPILSEEVQKALNALPEEYRAVVLLADMEQMDYAEVSRVLRVPIGTVRSRLHRGRALLRKLLARCVEP